jgi:hypothetical protein
MVDFPTKRRRTDLDATHHVAVEADGIPAAQR